ncbi:4'-phosphopantetheinyl transferase family protein [Flammeovirga agarivorans]|uniref:4'-phosphopantetheinyl transferase superfamily protein n=1 Tax=Flammeovirga agarivorans TaxID=2726742 RepID=A0A7X8SLA6_9BACT|nr:4'-phosphopantetheinyl transferase superfamily protein [Flammeovirga agarivorans]NLR92230.1 4'-phosphopantetheinyl transferase superfamily protein [Flammeovirga agarivorans]
MELLDLAKEEASTFAHIKNDKVRRQSISGRAALTHLLGQLDLEYHGIHKNENGKPFLVNSEYSISISHSRHFACAMISLIPKDFIGIDIEMVTPKVLRLISRFANPDELKFAQSTIDGNPQNATVIWTLKEAAYKAFGQLNIEFKSQIKSLFGLNNEIEGIEINTVQGKAHQYSSKIYLHEDFVVSITYQ